ncbi:MAG: methionine transporter substrate-binding protein [Clostridiaceae bacterium]|nr:methionine transporter substrate-binding protein [Clostridiaceae bacterium]
MFLNSSERKLVGFTYLIDKIQITTPYGMELKKSITPFREMNKLQQEFNAIEKIKISMERNADEFNKIRNFFCSIKDIRNTIKRCSNDEILDQIEIYEIKYLSILLENIREIYEILNIQVEGIHFCELNPIIEILDPEKRKLSTFYIYNGYSKELAYIREEKKNLEEQIYVSKDEKEIDKLKKERMQWVIKEGEEELVIRKKLCKKLKEYINILLNNIESVGRLDFLMGKVLMGGCKADISENHEIYLKKAYNPMVSDILEKKKKIFTPISIQLKPGATIITGANMGGKSIAIKTIVLNLMLFTYGFNVFCEEGKIPILQFIQYVSEDMQSISKGLSSFAGEIIKIKDIISLAKSLCGFIALDEFARGTNPKEGSCLVKAVSTYLNKLSTYTLIATHYDGIADENMDHYQVIGLKNADFNMLKNKIKLNKTDAVETIQEEMEYGIEKKSKYCEVPKDAVNICRLLGLDEEILDLIDHKH